MHIFFYCDQPSPIMEAAKECAVLHSPKSTVITLVGATSKRADRFRNLAKLLPTANPFSHEIACLLRWIYLLDYMQTEKVEAVVACDTDCLVFQDMEAEEDGWFRDFDYTLGDTGDYHRQCSSSLIRLPVLQAFVAFLFSRNGVELHDMRAWADFRTQNPQFRCGNYGEIRNGTVYDLNLSTELHRYESEQIGPDFRKRVGFWRGMPFVRILNSDRLIRFKLLHCWSWSKAYMTTFIKTSKETLASDV